MHTHLNYMMPGRRSVEVQRAAEQARLGREARVWRRYLHDPNLIALLSGQAGRELQVLKALTARRGSHERVGGVVMGRGRGLALAAVLAMMVCGCLAAQADAFVYWTNNAALGRANLDGSGVNQNLIGVGLGVFGIAVDGPRIYWTNYEGDTIGRANLDGSDANKSFISGASFPQGLAVVGEHIYWANNQRDTIARANLDGSGVDQSFITGASGPEGLAVDGQHIYWTNALDDTIGRANLDGTGVDQSFITGAGFMFGVAADGQHVYWTDYNGLTDSGTIGRANLDGSGANQSFITGLGFPQGVAVDGQHVYWADLTQGSIGRANLDGSGVDGSFIVGADHPDAVAVDALPLAPSASIAIPASGATYTVGQALDSSFTCSDGAGGPGIASCLDQSGRGPGARIDTSSPGSHTFTITATSTRRSDAIGVEHVHGPRPGSATSRPEGVAPPLARGQRVAPHQQAQQPRDGPPCGRDDIQLHARPTGDGQADLHPGSFGSSRQRYGPRRVRRADQTQPAAAQVRAQDDRRRPVAQSAQRRRQDRLYRSRQPHAQAEPRQLHDHDHGH